MMTEKKKKKEDQWYLPSLPEPHDSLEDPNEHKRHTNTLQTAL